MQRRALGRREMTSFKNRTPSIDAEAYLLEVQSCPCDIWNVRPS